MNKGLMTLIGTAAVAIISAGASLVNTYRTNRTMKKLNDSFKHVEEISEEKITESVIKRAVEKAADEQVELYMKRVRNDVLEAADRNLNNQATS